MAPRTNGDLDTLAEALEEAPNQPPPPNVRALLGRLDDRSGFVMHAVGRLTREVSAQTTRIAALEIGVREVKEELRKKADRRQIGEIRREMDSVSDLADEAKQAAEITKTTQIKELQAKLDAMTANERRAEEDRRGLEKERRQFRQRLAIALIVALIASATAIVREFTHAKSEEKPAPTQHVAP